MVNATITAVHAARESLLSKRYSFLLGQTEGGGSRNAKRCGEYNK